MERQAMTAICKDEETSVAKTELDVVEKTGLDEEPRRGIQRYDHARRRAIVAEFLHETCRGRVLYLGCSNGFWYPFCKEQGFGGHALSAQL